ncbi:HK97 family phage prohead protease [Pseudonocardia adelaidensis]|uniref:hypothetical protein n=1 Tax=Pseudonocardia adelaidensis TaxID=648754 RepID=UPI0031E5B033
MSDVHNPASKDILVPGCSGRTLKSIKTRMVLGHDWNRVVGQTISAVELLPGDPRLPRTAPDGTPWPREAGALLVKARFLLGTADGRNDYEVARAFEAEQNFSIGFKVKKARQQGGIRRVYDLDMSGAARGEPAGHPAEREERGRPSGWLRVNGGLRDREQLICSDSCASSTTRSTSTPPPSLRTSLPRSRS